MKRGGAISFAAWCLVVVLVANVAAADICNQSELQDSCSPVIFGMPPTAECCTKLNAQMGPCYCNYLKDRPDLKTYAETSQFKNFAADCAAIIPSC